MFVCLEKRSLPRAFFIFLSLKKSKNAGSCHDGSKSDVVSSFSAEWIAVSVLGNS